ncbi:hypothetical protein I4U23_000959 [Adineta vaga]|nr:hypothetical protein I4U23_000959 [Adineta vaga]
MISHRLRSLPVNGYYEYLSQIRYRVNVTPNEAVDTDETMKQTIIMENDSKSAVVRSSSADNISKQLPKLPNKDVTKWSSTDVQHWVEDQCRKFELTRATSEKFQMNGQALVLLTKHDFLRRSPDGGEILYYALQRLINPNKFNSVRVGQSLLRSKTTRQNPRIIELDSDTDEHNSVTSNSSSTKPIIEEPDDPPLRRSPDSDSTYESYPQQPYSHSFIYANPHIRPTVYAMPTTPTGTYYQQQPYANTYMYPQHPMHQFHPQMPQQQFYQAHAQQPQQPQQHPNIQFFNQYYSMMAAQGILIEVIDPEEANNLMANGVTAPSQSNDNSTNSSRFDGQENLYLVTMNGQRFIMTEEYIRQIVVEIQQQQQQQQQQFQQQQHFHQPQHPQFHHAQPQQQYTYQPQASQPPQDNIYYTA